MARALVLVAACMLMAGLASAQVNNLAWCRPQDEELYPDGSNTPVNLGMEECVDLCVQRSGDPTVAQFGVEVRQIFDEVANVVPPSGTVFAYPYDEINFPPEADTRWQFPLGSNWELESTGGSPVDPFEQRWCFTPSPTSECAYTVCFEAYYEGDNSVLAEKRCVKINVVNSVMEFDPDDHGKIRSAQITPQNGYFMAGWVYPSCDAAADKNMTVLSFISERGENAVPDQFGRIDSGLDIRGSINYEPSTGTFFYYDCYMGEAMSKPEYCCNKWHYVGVSVEEDGKGKLFVDGIGPKLMSEKERDIIKYSVVEFETESRPDSGNQGFFAMGPNFHGWMDDVGFWDESKTPEEYEALHYTRDFENTGFQRFFDSGPKYTIPSGVQQIHGVATPSMTPCVLGMEHNVGPVDGACVTEVYGWNFADGMNPKCNFGGVEMKAAVLSMDKLKCETPGHVSPRFVDVTASNDGFAFGDEASSGKAVKHLFLESSLYLTGEGNGGAEADSVCNDLPTKAVSFGAWVCPKCGPPVPPPPPSPSPPPFPAQPPSPSPPPPSPPPPVILGEGS